MAAVISGAVMAAGPLPDLGVLGSADRNDGFAQVLEPRTFEFPRDHGPHPQYRQEWWYVTGNLDGAGGERFGVELTFFRFALAPLPGRPAARVGTRAATAGEEERAGEGEREDGGRQSRWRARQIYMAHFAVTDVGRKRFRFAQKLSRDALGLAGAVESEGGQEAGQAGGKKVGEGAGKGEGQRVGKDEEQGSLRVWIDDWYLRAVLPEATEWSLHAAENGYELTLNAQVSVAPVLNGERGLSRKSSEPGSASYYYSIPRVTVRGRLVRDGKPVDVHGMAWVDREWGSGTLGRGEQGWDWFALELQDGNSLMFYALRNRDGGWDPHSAGTWVSADGESRALAGDQVRINVEDYWKSPRGGRYPARWRVRVPAEGIDLDVRPALPDQELTTSPRYWEGAVDVAGTSRGRETQGRGYVELVGYGAQ
ncbi:MAG TPA: lipocalin-like domain-containing protein [Steroidobacteraceae bacterium]|nr:lipocalin-like domain-containing protein [Steroidobacteraceae bacterium]